MNGKEQVLVRVCLAPFGQGEEASYREQHSEKQMVICLKIFQRKYYSFTIRLATIEIGNEINFATILNWGVCIQNNPAQFGSNYQRRSSAMMELNCLSNSWLGGMGL